MNGEVVSTGQGISVVEEIDQETTDTYAKAREVAEQQITKEQAVHDAHDAIESDVLGLWDEFIEIPYGNFTMRIRADLPSQKHDALRRFTQTIGETKCDPSSALPMVTLGLYNNDDKISETDAKFWSNPDNWSDLKINQIVSAYMRNYMREVEQTTSFLNDKTT